MVAITAEVPGKAAGIAEKECSEGRSRRHRSACHCVHIRAAGQSIPKAHFAGAVGIAGNSLLLCATKICTPTDRVIADGFGPVVHPLELVLCLFQRAIALIDVQGIAEVKSSRSTNVKSRHAAGLACT